MKNSILALSSILILACGASSDTGVNKSFTVSDGEHRSGGLRSVNGSIHVGHKATVDGDCSTVNGEITLGEGAQVGEISCVNGQIDLDRGSRAKEVSCVNGSIKLGGEVRVAGDVSTVNGEIQSKPETQIDGELSTVNGDMKIEETLITGNVSSVNGDIDLLEKSIVKGSIIIDRDHKKPRFKDYKELTITVASGSKVYGDIKVKGDQPNVTVVLAGKGEVLGEIINAKVVRK